MAQQGGGHGGSRHSQNELYSIPAELCSEFAEFMDARWALQVRTLLTLSKPTGLPP